MWHHEKVQDGTRATFIFDDPLTPSKLMTGFLRTSVIDCACLRSITFRFLIDRTDRFLIDWTRCRLFLWPLSVLPFSGSLWRSGHSLRNSSIRTPSLIIAAAAVPLPWLPSVDQKWNLKSNKGKRLVHEEASVRNMRTRVYTHVSSPIEKKIIIIGKVCN